MNYKLLLGLILLSVIVFPYLPAATQTTGQFPSTITWGVTTQQDVGILRVASGDYDVFMFSNPLFWYDTLDPTVRANLTLIRTVTTYVDLVFNPAQNVIDPNAEDYPEFIDKNYPGYYIPGLLLVDPDDLGLATYEYPVVKWDDVIANPTAIQNLHFNPLAIREIRFALNYLIDRQLIVDQIYHGSATPRFGCISQFHPYYPNIEDDYFTMFGFSAAGDVARAQNIYLDALTNVNATLLSVSGGSMYIYFKPDPNAPGGKWLYFHKPDGSEEPVVINFLIRIEDERKDIGLQIADWIEKYFYIKVNRYLRERTIIYTAYFSNPVKTDEFGFIDTYWSIYTEGWVSTAEDIDVYARYDVAFFYLPLGGYGPNGYYWIGAGWYWYNETLFNYMMDAYYGTYTPEQKDTLIGNIRIWFIEGLRQSIRVFIADSFEYFAANKNTFAGVVPGVVTGLYTVWALRTMQFTKPTAKLLEFSATGALFMSVWNPVMGFTDIYSELMHRMLTDFSFWPRPDNGMPAPIRVASYKVERGPYTLDEIDGYIYDPVQDKWVHLTEANDEFVWYTYEGWGGYPIAIYVYNITIDKDKPTKQEWTYVTDYKSILYIENATGTNWTLKDALNITIVSNATTGYKDFYVDGKVYYNITDNYWLQVNFTMDGVSYSLNFTKDNFTESFIVSEFHYTRFYTRYTILIDTTGGSERYPFATDYKSKFYLENDTGTWTFEDVTFFNVTGSWTNATGWTHYNITIDGNFFNNITYFNATINFTTAYGKAMSLSYDNTTLRTVRILTVAPAAFTAACKVTFNFVSPDGVTLGKWHDGSNITMADILYDLGFSYEWRFPDDVATGEPDPYYYSGLERGLAGLATILGIKVVNNTAITIWVNYDDVYDVLVADYAAVWPDMPWHVMAAAEELVAEGKTHAGTGLPYLWEDIAGQYKGIDFLDTYCVQDVKNMLSSFAAGTIPHGLKYIETYPGIGTNLLTDKTTRYNNAINFIDTYGHAYISSGPYFVSSYDPNTYTMVMQAFPDYPVDRTAWLTAYTVKTVSVTKVTAPTTVWLAFNGSLKMRIDIEFYQITPTYKKLSIDPSKVFVTVSIFYYNGTKLADVPRDYITVLSNGSIIIDVPPSWLHQIWPKGGTPGYIVYNVGYEESAATVTGYVETDFYSTPIPKGVPEPTILPLLVLVALLLFILVIRRK